MKEKVEFIRDLIGLAEANELSELSVDFRGFKVAIKKGSSEQAVPYPVMVQQSMSPAAVPAMTDEAPPAEEKIPDNLVPVISPLAGVFYRSPKPGAPPFAGVGEVVEKDQVLCIVEAMKIMNEITSEIRGKVAKICLENADVANQGDPLLYLEPLD